MKQIQHFATEYRPSRTLFFITKSIQENNQVGRKQKSNFKTKKKFGKRGTQTQNSVEVQNTKSISAECNVKNRILKQIFLREVGQFSMLNPYINYSQNTSFTQRK